MAKKRKAARQPEAPSGPREYDAKDSRLTVNTYADIADEQEEYFLDQDKISLEDDERGTKRQRQQELEDEFVDLSDDEVFRRDSDDSANESANDDDSGTRRKQKKKEKKAKAKKAKAERAAKLADDDDDDDDEANGKAAGGEEDDSGWWGSSKEHYYDGDAIETEDGAMEEEREARRLQKKQLSRMKASDFFDADEWANDDDAKTPGDQNAAAAASGISAAAAAGPGGAVTMTIMSKSEIDSMTGDERYKLLQEHYPELDHLCDEFSALEPLMTKYKELAVGKGPETLEVTQFRALSCYVATMALYFSILMSPSRDDPNGPRYVMDPDELHNHEVMEYLVVTRNNWEWVKRVQARRAAKASKEQKLEAAVAAAKDTIPEMMAGSKSKKKAAAAAADQADQDKATKKEKKEKTDKKDKKDKKSKRASAVSQELEASLADLANLIPAKGKKAKKLATKAAKAAKTSAGSDDDQDDSDLGEEETLDARTAEEKLKRKKSLGFYTSQIMQKSSMRSGATGQSGGDVDIPYRERLRDRQERLHAAAVRRGMNEASNELGGGDDDLGSGSDAGSDEGNAEAAKERDANLSYYDSIVNAHKEKMAAKAARKAENEALKLQRVTPAAWADQDGRRQLTWEIEKNKGLSHRTLKEKKNNPRVKKRLKFEKKKKQLASMRAIYKPMNPSEYKGERTGIKTGLIRSIKLD